MLSSPIIDLAIGLVFVFGVTAAFASLATELIARFIGLRGAYLLSGLRELVDGGDSKTNLSNMANDYNTMRSLIQGTPKLDAEPTATQPSDTKSAATKPSDTEPPHPSVTSALLGGPILGNQGVAGQLSSRSLELYPTSGSGRLPKMAPVPKPKDQSDQKAGDAPGQKAGDTPGQKAGDTPGQKAGGLWSWLRSLPSYIPLWRQRRSLPSYISGRSFGEAVIDLVVPDASGHTTMDDIRTQVNSLPDWMSPLKPSLQGLVKDAGDDIGRFRTSLEKWYDDHMDRVSGWYKRHVAVFTLVAGTVIVILLNLNALSIGRTLYTENAVSAAVSTVAAKATSCAGEKQQDCLANLEGQLSAVAAAGLPVGWGTVRDCTGPGVRCNWWDRRGILSRHGNSAAQLLLILAGFLIMIISMVPGAQFWFGLLTKLNALRAAGPPPASPASNSVNVTITSPPVAPAQAVVATAALSTATPEPKSPLEPNPPD
jgi:hypothetical protein